MATPFRPLILLATSLLLGLSWWNTTAQAGPYAALIVDVENDHVLYERNADAIRHPASLTKMMTLYLTFEALAQGRWSLRDSLPVSSYASSRSPSKLGLRPGDLVTVEDCVLGLVTQSANDAATVLAEGLGGTEQNFAYQMTHKARDLSMNTTIFKNASGLPDPLQITSARDMYRLGKALLRDFPQFYGYFSTDQFVFRQRSFHNHNHLLNHYPGADGIKTGFVSASGFNLVASAKRDGHRLIGVVFGGNSHGQRDAHMKSLLDDGFAQLQGQTSRYLMADNTGFEGSSSFPTISTAVVSSPQQVIRGHSMARATSHHRSQGQGDITERRLKKKTTLVVRSPQRPKVSKGIAMSSKSTMNGKIFVARKKGGNVAASFKKKLKLEGK